MRMIYLYKGDSVTSGDGAHDEVLELILMDGWRADDDHGHKVVGLRDGEVAHRHQGGGGDNQEHVYNDGGMAGDDLLVHEGQHDEIGDGAHDGDLGLGVKQQMGQHEHPLLARDQLEGDEHGGNTDGEHEHKLLVQA